MQEDPTVLCMNIYIYKWHSTDFPHEVQLIHHEEYYSAWESLLCNVFWGSEGSFLVWVSQFGIET